MKIPTGDFGYRVAQPERMPNASPDAYGAGIGESMQRLGGAGVRIADDMQQQLERQRIEAEREAEKKRQENEALARAKAGNVLLDHEISVKVVRQKIEQGLEDGSIHYDQAEQVFDETLAKMEPPAVEGMDAVIAENLDKGTKRINFAERFNIQGAVEKSRKADHKTQTDAAMDKLGKLAGMPGADVGAITAKVPALDAIGQSAYGKDWGKKKQDFIDGVWTQHAIQQSMAAGDDLGALKQLQVELTDEKGFYADKLDADKRSAVLRSVIGSIDRLENKITHETERREAKAERTIGEIDRQISTGTPATVEQWAAWADQVKGTAFEPLFRERIEAEVQVQNVLKQPIQEQLAFVQKQEQQLATNGGSLQQQANVARIRKAVESNIKQLQDNPLQYNAVKTGQPVPPLDLTKLADPNGALTLAGQMKDRLSALDAMRRQYGDVVQIRPFMPQEAATVSNLLREATPKQQVQLFGTLRNAFHDEQGYMAAMQQIAPDSPVKAMAGMLYAKQRTLVIKGDESATSGDVAETMLIGESILNKTKADKAEDGKPKNFPIPLEKDFRDEFASVAGNVFAGRAGAYETAMQAVRAYYTGSAAQDGDVSGEMDNKRMRRAIKATLGEVVDVNGNGEVLAPWGMTKDEFEDKAESAFKGAVLRHGLNPRVADQYGAYGLKNAGNGLYYVVNGRNFLTDSKGEFVMIDLDKPLPPEKKPIHTGRGVPAR